ncbi:hypothetical protein GCM10010911_63970 [Paenibacillus nasutitermitis]|uniref:Uncharacterized protein n=1 Tax=Paenibacillus nasutitermitis TaxID=1652958 RepID=A0A916ZHB6_9BACL|nr:hypothetical protein GCM10010911_63970 [Paenibacillus nasutitermitis]
MQDIQERLGKDQASFLELAKILLVALDIHLQRDKAVNQSIKDKLQKLFNIYSTENPD